MRAEDKYLDGPELERAQRREQREQREEADHELPETAGETEISAEVVSRDRLLGAVHAILDDAHLSVAELGLPARTTNALEFLRVAVRGRDGRDEFVYASDRRTMLEQSLAVLQQNLTLGDRGALAELHAKHEALTAKIEELRRHLKALAQAQRGKRARRRRPKKQEGDDANAGAGDKDTDDDDELEDEDADDDAEAAEPVKPPTTLGDPDEIAVVGASWWRKHGGR